MTNEIKEYRTLWDIYMPITEKIVAGEKVSTKDIYRAKEIAKDIFEKEFNKRESKES